jgi:hypothetical protein
MQTFDSVSAALRSMAMLQCSGTPEIVNLEGCTSRQRLLSEIGQCGTCADRLKLIAKSCSNRRILTISCQHGHRARRNIIANRRLNTGDQLDRGLAARRYLQVFSNSGNDVAASSEDIVDAGSKCRTHVVLKGHKEARL